MSTPKEKLNKGQALNAKRKKFFRILQSASSADGRYCATVGDRLRAELEAKITAVFEAAKKARQDATTNAGSTVHQEGTKKSKKELWKLNKLNAAKAVKCPDLIVGMESTLRLIDQKQVAMVWLDSSLASNLVNVIHKLCIANRIFCLDLDLSPLRTLSNIKSMTMVSFRSAVQQAKSPLHDLYQFVVTSVFRSTQTETIKASSGSSSGGDIEPANESKDDKHEPKNKQQPPSQPPQSSTTFPAKFKFYLTNDADHEYAQIMRRRLKSTDDSRSSTGQDDIANQASLIVLAKPKEDYFPAYDSSSSWKQRIQVKITIEQKESKAQTASSANRLAEKLFDIDKLNSSIESSGGGGSSSRTTFKSPKLVRGEVVQTAAALSTGKRKRANNNSNNKGANKGNKSNKKAKRT